VDVGNYFHDMNLFGAYMQWDEYDGFDDDQCVFIPKSSFSNCFYGDFPFDSETKPSRGERLYKKKKFRNRYRDILLAKTSKDFVEFMESTNELHKVRLHCTCSYCQNGLVAKQFGSFFFTITGFHGLHVLGGVILNIYLLLKTAKGDFDRLGHYEMVEKIGLYWHFVDLVWVYVFLAFYLM
jgi:hypothetical protein